TVKVLGGGVRVVLDPPSGSPGGGFQMTVTNTGQVADTFDLALAGPGALVATLGTTEVSLAPGASQVIPITTGAIDFALPGALYLTAMATSRSVSFVRDTASIKLLVPTSRGLQAHFDNAVATIPEPGGASFLLLVTNTGNTEDAFAASITGV